MGEAEKMGRFAPSPTGRMHLGNVFSALLSWLSAKSKGGKWLLRIEDIDPQRSKQHYAETLMDDLEWLGLTWDEGPRVSGNDAMYYQSKRGDIYEQYLSRLKEKGLIYESYKTRAERLAVGAPQTVNQPVAPMEGQRPALMLRTTHDTITYEDGHYGMQRVNISEEIGDFIVRRRDGAWAYQLAVVVDDALMGVTEVVRGRDLLQSAAQQLYMAELLDLPKMTYTHLPLLCNEAGQRLSKRDKSLDMGVLRDHYSAEEIIGRLAHVAGIIPDETPMRAAELIPLFSWEKVPQSNIIM